jgi:hypothetical protein
MSPNLLRVGDRGFGRSRGQNVRWALKAGAILEKLFDEEPAHPGLAHYIIHTYDVPALAGRAMVAARRYSEIAPDAPHALHMPSHTFTRTGYWQESIDSNIAAAAAARREGQTAEELHASDYEIYAYLQTGQDKAARQIVESLPEIASRFDPKAVLNGSAGPPVGYFCPGGNPGALRARTSGLEAGCTTRAAGDTISLYGRNDVARPRLRRGATRTCAGSERVSGSARADPRAAFKSRRKLLGAAGGDTGGYSSGMGCACRGSKRRSPAEDEVGSAIGRRDGEKRGYPWTSGARARVTG